MNVEAYLDIPFDRRVDTKLLNSGFSRYSVGRSSSARRSRGDDFEEETKVGDGSMGTTYGL